MSMPNKLIPPRKQRRQNSSAAFSQSRAPTQRFLGKSYFYLGLALLAMFSIQEVCNIRWSWLTALQADDDYKQLSGFVLVFYLIHQWQYSMLRNRGLVSAAGNVLNRHKVLGAMAPLVFYAHAQSIGFAYLTVLSLAFFGIFLTGLFNYEISRIKKPWFRPIWIALHVGFSTGLLFLLSYHVFISYAYK